MFYSAVTPDTLRRTPTLQMLLLLILLKISEFYDLISQKALSDCAQISSGSKILYQNH